MHMIRLVGEGKILKKLFSMVAREKKIYYALIKKNFQRLV